MLLTYVVAIEFSNHGGSHLDCIVSKTWRKRVFILAKKPGFTFAEANCLLMFFADSKFLVGWKLIRSCQDKGNLMSKEEVHKYSAEEWQPQTKPQVLKWLQPCLTQDERERLKSMGNIVVPQLANFAAHLLCQSSDV